MLKNELLNTYGIVDWMTRESKLDYLFSMGQHDPVVLADMDGYEMANGRPFCQNLFIGPNGAAVIQVIVFRDVVCRYAFQSNNVKIDLSQQ